METPSPELQALTHALAELVRDCAATLGAIVDESSVVWCTVPTPQNAQETVAEFFRAEIAPNIKALLHGHRLSVHRASGPHRYVAESFAALYVIVLWLEEEFDTEFVRARIRLALPKIEALTLAVPPFDGPDGSGGAQKRYG
ncbi:MAG TPA: hypothetical protein VHM25_25970 [Polyangiaceae bacterium]|jgi:hypothetical protein|nr:hypothetical protein [Polyangiaceae bacterium]